MDKRPVMSVLQLGDKNYVSVDDLYTYVLDFENGLRKINRYDQALAVESIRKQMEKLR